MSPQLRPGQRLTTENIDAPIVVEEFIKEGGQGEVYACTLGDMRVALKWYSPDAPRWWAERQRARLSTAIKRGAPNANFVWPIDLVTTPGHSAFGYVMPWIAMTRFREWHDVVLGRVDPSFRILARACREVATGYQALHAKGLCYYDINFGNVFFDQNTGDALICDNDNVDVNGTPSSMTGTLNFMAPEIVRQLAPYITDPGNAANVVCTPTTKTDLWSLAVLFYYAFFREHPLMDGSRSPQMLSPDAFIDLNGLRPRFVFDRPDEPDGNKPFPLAAAHWEIYPDFLRQLFMKAFTAGIVDPEHGRVTESEWRWGMARVHDCIVACPCGTENFFDVKKKPFRCWSCAQALAGFRVLTCGDVPLPLSDGARLYPHHLDPRRSFDFTGAVAEVIRNPERADVIGLVNLGSEPWNVVLPDGQTRVAETGRPVALQPGVRIAFGRGRREGVVT
jgi:serine/threonine protein kinase